MNEVWPNGTSRVFDLYEAGHPYKIRVRVLEFLDPDMNVMWGFEGRYRLVFECVSAYVDHDPSTARLDAENRPPLEVHGPHDSIEAARDVAVAWLAQAIISGHLFPAPTPSEGDK